MQMKISGEQATSLK